MYLWSGVAAGVLEVVTGILMVTTGALNVAADDYRLMLLPMLKYELGCQGDQPILRWLGN